MLYILHGYGFIINYQSLLIRPVGVDKPAAHLCLVRKLLELAHEAEVGADLHQLDCFLWPELGTLVLPDRAEKRPQPLDGACRRALAEHLHRNELQLLDLRAVLLPPLVRRHVLRVFPDAWLGEDALGAVLENHELRACFGRFFGCVMVNTGDDRPHARHALRILCQARLACERGAYPLS